MRITNEVVEAHRQLSDTSAAFLEFAQRNPDCLNRAGFDMLLSDKRFTYFRSQPWPTFINGKSKKEMEEAVRKIHDLIISVIPRFFSYDLQKISSYYRVDPAMTKLLLHGVNDDYLTNLLGRGDFIRTPSGEFKCLEFNMHANMGGWEVDLLESVYLNVPVIAEFLKEHNVRVRKNHFFHLLFEHVLEAFLEKHPGACETGEVNMAIAFPGGSGFDKDGIAEHLRNLYKHILGRKNNALKGDIFVCGYKSLKTSGGFLSYEGRRIHILVEMLNGLVPIMFMEVVKKGNLMLYNGPVTRIISNKLNLALLSEHQDSDIFSLEEREVIKKYIPWTRKVVPGLEDFLLSDRERMVLKSAEGLGGKEVFPGYSTPPEEWEQRVEKALQAQNWVVQEYVPTVSYLYQDGETGCTGHHAIWGIFVFGSRCAGGFVRMMPEKNSRGVINSRQGAEESIIIEVDES